MCKAILKSVSTTTYDKRYSAYPENCKMELVAEIGLENSNGSDSFYFTVVTVQHIEAIAPTWFQPKKGCLILTSFNWAEVEDRLNRLLQHQPNGSWEEKAAFLSNYLHWEFENYQPNL